MLGVSTKQKMFWICVFSFIIGVVSLFAYKQLQRSQLEAPVSATLLKQPRAVTPFVLTDTQGQRVTQQQLRGHWSLLFFGFTHCQSICPTTMAELAKMQRQLRADSNATLPRVTLVSLDPEADVPSVLKAYVESFDKSFYGLTGDSKQLKRLTRQLGIAVMRSAPHQPDHSGTLVLVNPQAKVLAYFSMPHDGVVLAKDFEKIVRLYR
jgi:protein SCO1